MKEGLKKLLPLLVAITLSTPALAANATSNKVSCNNDLLSGLVKVGLFVAGAYSVYIVTSTISAILASSVNMLPNYTTAGVLGILLPLLGTIGIVFIMWFLTYTLFKEK